MPSLEEENASLRLHVRLLEDKIRGLELALSRYTGTPPTGEHHRASAGPTTADSADPRDKTGSAPLAAAGISSDDMHTRDLYNGTQRGVRRSAQGPGDEDAGGVLPTVSARVPYGAPVEAWGDGAADAQDDASVRVSIRRHNHLYKSHLDPRGAAAMEVRVGTPLSPGDDRVGWASREAEVDPAGAPFDTRRKNEERNQDYRFRNTFSVNAWDDGTAAATGGAAAGGHPGAASASASSSASASASAAARAAGSRGDRDLGRGGRGGNDGVADAGDSARRDGGAAPRSGDGWRSSAKAPGHIIAALREVRFQPHQYAASSEQSAAHRAASADPSGPGWWPLEDKPGQFVQMNTIAFPVDIDAIATLAGTTLRAGQRSGGRGVWVTKFRVKTSDDGRNWNPYVSASGESIIDANTDDSSWSLSILDPPIRGARHVRIYPVAWNGHIALRVQLLHF